MNAEFEAPKDVPAVQQAGDTSGLSSAQSDSFKGFDNFSSIKSSMSDSSNTGLPELQLLDTDSQPADTNDNRGPGENQNPGDSPQNPDPDRNQNPGDSPQNPDPNRNQNPGDGGRNDDPRSKNQPGSDADGKQLDESASKQADDGTKPGPDDPGASKQPGQDDPGASKQPGQDDPGASKQPDPDGQKAPRSEGAHTSALPPQDALPGGGGSDGKTDPANPGVTPRPEYNF